jgi:hypothetical protein
MEDLGVCARVLRKLVDPYGQWGSHDAAGRLYLQGHGIVFTMAAPFPLVADTHDAATDDPGGQAAREIAAERAAPRSRPWHNPAQVQELTRNIVTGMSFAANIRSLPADGIVTVIVTEHDPNEPPSAPDTEHRHLWVGPGRGRNALPPELSRLVVSVDIADVRQLAAGKIDMGSFARRTRVHAVANAVALGRASRVGALGAALKTALEDPDALGETAVAWTHATRVDGFGVLLVAHTGVTVAWPRGPEELGRPDPVDSLWGPNEAPSVANGPTIPADPLGVAVEAILDAFTHRAVSDIADGESLAAVVYGVAHPMGGADAYRRDGAGGCPRREASRCRAVHA